MSNSSFSINTKKFGLNEFMTSDSIMVKFAFILLILFGFIILLKIGIEVLMWAFSHNDSPKLINGMVDATQMVVYPQDPNDNSSSTIYRSVNATDGIEFTWSVWIYINNLQHGQGVYKNVFYKGSNNINTDDLSGQINSPGLYIAPNTNELIVKMNTFNKIDNEINVPDIPLNKWVNVIIRCQNTTIDVYINGTIARSIELKSVPKQNYGDVFVANGGGFSGYISNLWYYNYALGTVAISKISENGPSTTIIGSTTSSGLNNKSSDYLSLRWFFGNDYK